MDIIGNKEQINNEFQSSILHLIKIHQSCKIFKWIQIKNKRDSFSSLNKNKSNDLIFI
jgi:hypothetical protein